MDDEPQVDYLEGWDSEPPPPSARAARSGLLLVLVVVVIAAVVLAVVTGGTRSSATLPPTNPLEPAPAPGTPSISLLGVGDFTPNPYPDDVEQVPLTISVKDPSTPAPDGILSFEITVCVDASVGSITGGRVPIFREFFTLRSPSTNELLSPMPNGAGRQPEFPYQWYYLKGQCAHGFVSFQPSPTFVPQYLQYADQRLIWTWRLS